MDRTFDDLGWRETRPKGVMLAAYQAMYACASEACLDRRSRVTCARRAAMRRSKRARTLQEKAASPPALGERWAETPRLSRLDLENDALRRGLEESPLSGQLLSEAE